MDTNKSLLQEEWVACERNIHTKQKQKLIQKQRRILRQIPKCSNKYQDKPETYTKKDPGQTTKVLVCPNPKKAGAMELSVCLSVQFHWCPRGSGVLIIILQTSSTFWKNDNFFLTFTLFVGGSLIRSSYIRFDIWRLTNLRTSFPKEGTFSFDHFVVLTLHQAMFSRQGV